MCLFCNLLCEWCTSAHACTVANFATSHFFCNSRALLPDRALLHIFGLRQLLPCPPLVCLYGNFCQNGALLHTLGQRQLLPCHPSLVFFKATSAKVVRFCTCVKRGTPCLTLNDSLDCLETFFTKIFALRPKHEDLRVTLQCQVTDKTTQLHAHSFFLF